MSATGAAFARGSSEQAVGTPLEFLAAVERRFGIIMWDLAANDTNAVAGGWYGPGSPDGEDGLAADWSRRDGLLWLNPEFGDIAPWAAKAATVNGRNARVAMLAPASVGTLWWRDHVHQRADVYFLNPRLTFVGHTAPYPKDLALCIYGAVGGAYRCWSWKTGELR